MRIRAFAAAFAVVLAAAGPVHAKSAVQITSDETKCLVNKPVGTEQWVLVLDLDSETLTGNVFDTSGKPPTFFSCTADSVNGLAFPEDLVGDTVTLDCEVSDCVTLPCTQWHPLGTQIDLPGEFFLP